MEELDLTTRILNKEAKNRCAELTRRRNAGRGRMNFILKFAPPLFIGRYCALLIGIKRFNKNRFVYRYKDK
jgi:hypothetical protein